MSPSDPDEPGTSRWLMVEFTLLLAFCLAGLIAAVRSVIQLL